MENENDELKRKNNIRIRLRNEELSNFMQSLIVLIFSIGLFAYIGYSFCVDNNYIVLNGIILGPFIPLGLYFLKQFDLGNIFTYIIYFIVCILIFDKIPIFIGFLIWFFIILLFILKIVHIYTDKREYVVNTTYIAETAREYREKNKSSYKKPITHKKLKKIDDDDLDEYEYYCDRCDKRISQEEYELNAGMCDDCVSEVYFFDRYENDDFDMYR